VAAGDGRDDHGQHRDDVNQADRFASLEEDRLRFGADIAAVHRSASDDVAEEGDGRGDDDVLESRGDDAPDVGVLRDRALTIVVSLTGARLSPKIAPERIAPNNRTGFAPSKTPAGKNSPTKATVAP